MFCRELIIVSIIMCVTRNLHYNSTPLIKHLEIWKRGFYERINYKQVKKFHVVIMLQKKPIKIINFIQLFTIIHIFCVVNTSYKMFIFNNDSQNLLF